VGAGGHAKVVLDAALESQCPVACLVDDAPQGADLLGVRVISTADEVWLANRDFNFIVAVGDNGRRSWLFQKMLLKGGDPATIIHPAASVSRHAQVGRGTVICAGVVINAGAKIGENCILNTACSIDHDCRIGSHAHVCPGVHLAGNVVIGTGTMLGTGTAVIPGRTIGCWTTVGAGAAIVRDIPDRVVAFGVPARVMRHLPFDPQLPA
jgi:acetyltransferase EpsM